ncbi:restriction endonuclease subunit S [Pseudoalteromonas sp. SG43-6]|uniref:restriction endonuclease subunit S n=1 Tax=Pseudoalteromonas sp. SG43-6 TaxID=2760967 RepID=UPI0015FF5A93|nr:restriction endonuclease subunit S [Pseudoalteromonas sp. SG43-6]MBB1435088.1 restriction endonuclease subunit S [Pseudoalteromonas sp. SG43-6]
MGSEFKLGHRCIVKSSKRIFAREYVEHGIPFWRSKDVIDKALGVFSSYDLYISEERFEEIDSKFGSPQKGDLLLSSVGNRAGQPYVIEEEENFYFKDGNILWLSEFNGINPRFLAYWLKSDFGQNKLSSVMIGSAQKALTIDAIRNLSVKFPPEYYQVNAVKILLAIDNKIELNQKTNQTLEQMAQALFKSWFVDFDPVFDNLLASVDFKLENLETSLPDELKQKAQRRLAALNSLHNATECKASLSALAHELQALSQTKAPTPAAVQVSEKAAETPVKANFNANPKILAQHANTHAHFPNEFEHHEQLGWIPKGWEMNQLSEITTELRRGISPKYIEEGGVQVINQKCIRNHEVNFTPCRRNNTELRKITGRELNVGDLLINSTGVGTLGRMAQVKYLNEVTVVDSHVTVVRADSEIYPVYSFAQMMLSIEDKIEALGHGSTGQTELSRKTVSEQWVLVPKSKALNHLNSQLISISEKIVLNSRQINELTKLRDTLLPKLISGELQIPDVATDEETAD